VRHRRYFEILGGFNFLQTHKIMNWKKIILLSCVLPCVFAISTATAQMRGHRASTARMPMQRAPMLNSASGLRRFHHFNRFNKIIIFDNFGFPFFPFYYPYPYYPYDAYQGGYGNGSSVVELQRRLARAGYYHGAFDGIMGPATRRALRAYERDHNQSAYGMTDRY